MTTITIFHHPQCSKSREALVIAQRFAERNGHTVDIVEYLVTPPGPDLLASLHRQLGGALHDMVRTNEDEYASLELSKADERTLLLAISSHPILLQRPIVQYDGRAVIGRPPERLNELFQSE